MCPPAAKLQRDLNVEMTEVCVLPGKEVVLRHSVELRILFPAKTVNNGTFCCFGDGSKEILQF